MTKEKAEGKKAEEKKTEEKTKKNVEEKTKKKAVEKPAAEKEDKPGAEEQKKEKAAVKEAPADKEKEQPAESGVGFRGRGRESLDGAEAWLPKTKLGSDVLAGKYKNLEEVLEKGELILESEIVSAMLPDMMHEIIYIGGSPGKGGGIRRTATKMTSRMHKSGRRFKLTALSVVGNGAGIVGIGAASSKEHRSAIEKSMKNAKLNVIRVRGGCGSWECGCDGGHSIPFKVGGRSGSVSVTLIPAPKGVGKVASEETRKILKLAGIDDVWVKTQGKTSTRNNLALAVFDALKNLNRGKGAL